MNIEQLEQPLLAADERFTPEVWTTLGVTPHAVAPLPDEGWLRAHTVGELLEFLNEREETIHRMAADPCNYGYEPFVWKILDALCGFPWIDPSEIAIASETNPEKRAALEAQHAWCVKVRLTLLKQEERISVLLLNGGNRGSKSEWAASRVIRLLLYKAKSRAWCFHQDVDMSRQYQQPLLYKYMPLDLKTERGIRRNPTYVAYKPQTGFSDENFVLPNASDCSFRNYMQEFKKIQGGELDVVWCDELVPATWVKELKARVATRGGWLIITFTPIEGYTATVKMFLDMAITTRESVAFVLPEDGGKPELELAVQGEDASAWLEDRPSQPAVPAGRRFAKVKRVMRMPDKTGAVFFLHCWDNPFGNPRGLYALYASDTVAGQKMRFYGEATKAMSGQFPTFGSAHIVKPDAIPKRGTRVHVVDPCSGRNWAQCWAIIDRAPIGKRIWIYREWPCPGKYVPGVGDMGVWAEPGDKLDGERGPAQRPLGWGHERYKQEIMRLEGAKKWQADVAKPAPGFRFDDQDSPEPHPRAVRRVRTAEQGEDIYERIMDSRYGAKPTQTHEGTTTLLEECAAIGLDFVPASGRDISDGTELINNFLYYDREQPISSLNSPRLFVSEECQNHIFALQNWTGEDGKEGACKDFIDLLRYLVLADLDDYSEEDAA